MHMFAAAQTGHEGNSVVGKCLDWMYQYGRYNHSDISGIVGMLSWAAVDELQSLEAHHQDTLCKQAEAVSTEQCDI